MCAIWCRALVQQINCRHLNSNTFQSKQSGERGRMCVWGGGMLRIDQLVYEGSCNPRQGIGILTLAQSFTSSNWGSMALQLIWHLLRLMKEVASSQCIQPDFCNILWVVTVLLLNTFVLCRIDHSIKGQALYAYVTLQDGVEWNDGLVSACLICVLQTLPHLSFTGTQNPRPEFQLQSPILDRRKCLWTSVVQFDLLAIQTS